MSAVVVVVVVVVAVVVVVVVVVGGVLFLVWLPYEVPGPPWPLCLTLMLLMLSLLQ